MRPQIANDFKHLLPEHSDEELRQLKANVLADKQHVCMPPVIVWAMTKSKHIIVDGHHQYDIRSKNGCKIRYAVRNFPSRDAALKHALDVQFGRRNLDSGQRAMAYAKLPGYVRKEPEGEAEENGDGANLRLAEVAEAAGVSERTMSFAKKVVEQGSAEVVKATSAGEFAVSDAAGIVDLPKAKQAEIVRKVRDGKADTLREAAPKPRRSKATDFNPQELDKQPARQSKAKNGAPEVSRANRTKLSKIIGELIRQLDVCGIGDEFANCTNALAARVKKL
jgi:hypothetical protein